MAKRKLIIITGLVLLCFGVAVTSWASGLTAKDALILALKGADLENLVPPRVEYAALYKVTSFTTPSTDQPNLQGAALSLKAKVDAIAQQAEIGYLFSAAGKNLPGTVFIDGDKIILDRKTLDWLSLLVAGIRPETSYAYAEDPSIREFWQVLALYRNPLALANYNEAAAFVVEAVPDEYFRLAGDAVVVELDRVGLGRTLLALLQQAKAEPDRFAELVIPISSPDAVTKRAELRRQIELIPEPTPAEMAEFLRFLDDIEIKELRYTQALIPGGEKEFKASILLLPEGGKPVHLYVHLTASGPRDDMKGRFEFRVDIPGEGGHRDDGLDFRLEGDYRHGRFSGAAGYRFGLISKDLRMEMTAEESWVAQPDLRIGVPTLTPGNSVNLSGLISAGAGRVERVMPIWVNGYLLRCETPPFIENDRLMVPLRSVAEALGAEVIYNASGEVLVIRNHDVLRFRLNSRTYSKNGIVRTADVAPFRVGDQAFIPIRLLAEELGAVVDFRDRAIYITTAK